MYGTVWQAATSSFRTWQLGGPPMCNQSECPRIIISVYTVSHSSPFEQLWLQQCSWQASSPVASFSCSLWSVHLEQNVHRTTRDICTVVFNKNSLRVPCSLIGTLALFHKADWQWPQSCILVVLLNRHRYEVSINISCLKVAEQKKMQNHK